MKFYIKRNIIREKQKSLMNCEQGPGDLVIFAMMICFRKTALLLYNICKLYGFLNVMFDIGRFL